MLEEIKYFIPIRSNPTRGKNAKEKIAKNLKKLKKSSRLHFKRKRVKTGLKIEKNKFSFRTVSIRPEFENSKKISKKFKNFILASFHAETGRDRPKNREKKKLLFQSAPARPE